MLLLIPIWKTHFFKRLGLESGNCCIWDKNNCFFNNDCYFLNNYTYHTIRIRIQIWIIKPGSGSVTLKVKSLLFCFRSNGRPTLTLSHLCYFSPRTTWCASMLPPQSIWQRKNSGQLLRQGPLLTSLLQMKRQGNWRSQIWIFRSTGTYRL